MHPATHAPPCGLTGWELPAFAQQRPGSITNHMNRLFQQVLHFQDFLERNTTKTKVQIIMKWENNYH
jgi:hypothetical protein